MIRCPGGNAGMGEERGLGTSMYVCVCIHTCLMFHFLAGASHWRLCLGLVASVSFVAGSGVWGCIWLAARGQRWCLNGNVLECFLIGLAFVFA